MISVTATLLMTLAFLTTNAQTSENTVYENSFSAYVQTKLPELDYYEKYDEIRADGKAAVVYPIFTQSAYDWNGLHDFYTHNCDSCLETRLHSSYDKTFSASGNGFRILEFLGYEAIDDTDIDKNPQILTNYDKVILLHNEFVTQREFDAIINHPNVVYLYPNSLVSEVTVDYSKNTIKLLRGPGYPDENIKNGFDWKYDNTKYFDDWNCHTWEFYNIENGYMLNCYPETSLPDGGFEMLKALKNL